LTVALGVRLGPVSPVHRGDLASVIRSTGVFNEDEVGVALELFDDSSGDYEFIGAFDGDRLIGYACFGPTPATDRTYDLYWIAVHRDAQRSGAGSVLISEVEHRLHARRARLVVVETSSRADYEPTRAFYRKRGYRQSATVPHYYSHGDHRVIYTKSLPP